MAMRKSFIEIGYKVNKSGLTEAKTAVDKLIRSQEKMLNNLDAYDQRNRKIAASQQSVNSELQKTAAYQSQTAKEQAKVTDSVVKTRAEQRKLSEAEGKTRQKAVDTGDSIVRSNEKSARAVNRTRHSTEQASTSFDKLHGAGSRLVNMGSAISMAMLPVAAAFKKSAEEATNLENKYTTIRNLLHTGGESAGASAAETKQMEKDNNQFALQYGVSPVDMSKGGEELIRRGYSGSQELASHKYFLQAARASGDDYNSVVGYGAPALEQFGYKAKAGDSKKKMAAYTKTVLNQMAYGADLSATDFTGIGNSLRYAGSTAHSANQSLAGTIGAVGVLSNNGMDGTVAGTGLRKDLNSLLTVNSNGAKALKSIGLSPDDLRDSHNNLLSLDKEFELLNSHMKGMTDTQRAAVFHSLFGATGQESALILSKNVDQMKGLTNQIQNAEKQGHGKGYIADLAQKNMKSWKNQIEVFKQYLNVMGLGFTKTVLPGFTHMLTDTNHVLKALIKLPEPVKDLTGHVVALGSAMGVAYAGSKLLRKGLDWMGGGASTKVGRQTQMVENVAQTSETTAPAVMPTRSSVRATTGLRGKWSGLSGLSKATIVGVGLDAGMTAANGFKKGIGTKAGGQELWQSAGKVTGATIGGVLTGGNPVGIMIGEQAGNALVKVAAPYFRKLSNQAKPNEQRYNQRQRRQGGGPSAQQQRTNPYGSGAGTDFSGLTTGSEPVTPRDSKPSKKPSNPYSGLTSQNKSYIKRAVKLETQGNIEWAQSAGKTSKQLEHTYDSLYNLAKKRSDSRLSQEQKGYSYLKKQGLLSEASASDAYNSEKTSVQKRLTTLRSALNKIENSSKLSDSQRVREINKVNDQIISLTDKGALKQKKIMGSLMSSTTHLTTSGYAKILTASQKNERKTVASAQKKYDAEVSSADKQLKKAKGLAKSLPNLSEKQRKGIIAQATKQHDQAIAKARSQYTSTVKYAEKQRRDVVAAAKKEAGEAAAAFSTAAKNVGDSIPALIQQNMGAFGGSFQKPKTPDQATADSHNPGAKLANAAAKQNGTAKPSKPSFATGYSFAKGSGPIRATQMAMVNEAGAEVAYDPRTGRFRLLGDGPTITKLHAGEHVINARDTRKLFAGGLGKGKTLKGYASGTTSLKASSVGGSVKAKGFANPLGLAEKSTKKSMGKISKTVTGGYSKATKKSNRSISKFSTQSDRGWKGIHSGTKRYTQQIQKDTVKDYDQLQKGGDKQLTQMKSSQLATMGKLHKGMNSETEAIESDFGSIMGKLPGDAKSAMKGAISALNGGFSGINSTLSQFGGNKSVLKPIHYATGSNGPIDSDQLAVLNDADFGSRQELVGRGNQLLKPVGDNVAVPLRKGDEIFNGDQVERAKPYLPHFKKGTGASDSKLRKLASANASDPKKAFSHDFTSNVKPTGATLQKGVTNVASAGATKVGVPWTSAMYGYIESLINSGSGGGGPVLHSPGAGWVKTSGFGNRGSVGGGFSSHDGNDFSGAKVVHAMQDAVVTGTGGAPSGWGGGNGIGESVRTKGGNLSLIYQELNGKANSGADILVHVGDHVKRGQAIAKLGPSGTHVHVGASTQGLWSHGGGSTMGWLDVTKLNSNFGNSEDKKSKTPKVSKAMTALVKSQLGSKAISWIKKNLQDSIGDADVGALGGSVTSRARTLAKAIKSMYGAATNAGIAAVLGNWEFESGLNPGAINPGGGASGLGQWLGGRKANLISFAKKHGGNWKSASTQLEFALKGDGSDSSLLRSVLRGTGSVASLAAKFSNQWERGGYTAQHVAGARKIEAALGTGGQGQVGKRTLVGEYGPELVEFGQPATVRSASATRSLMKRGGAKTKPNITNTFHIDIHVDAKGGDVDEIVKKAGAKFRDELDTIIHAEMDNLEY